DPREADGAVLEDLEVPLDPVPSGSQSGPAAPPPQAVAADPPLKDQADRVVLQDCDLLDHPVTAKHQPSATAAAPDRQRTDPHRIGPFEGFDRGVPGIRHARLN